MRTRKEKLVKDESPYAELVQDSFYTWYIYIHHGIMTWGPEGGPFMIWGTRKMAMRKAERLLRKYIRRELRRTPRTIIKSDEYERGMETMKALAELRNPELAWDNEFERLELKEINR